MPDQEPQQPSVAMVCEKNHDKSEPDVFCPAVFCRICGERIVQAKAGNVYWRLDFTGPLERFYTERWPVTFAHKKCDRAVRPAGVYWMPLEDFVTFLARTLGATVPDESNSEPT